MTGGGPSFRLAFF